MKKSMKKFMVACAAVSAITVAAGMSAMAAATYDSATNVAAYDLPEAADGTQMTVLVVNKDKVGNVADDDILYINQDVKGGTGVDGTAELKAVEGGLADGTYVALVGYYNADGAFAIKTDNEFTIGNVNPPVSDTHDVLLGDVIVDGSIDTGDAQQILRQAVKKDADFAKTSDGMIAGDVIVDGSIDTGDAQQVLSYAVKKTSSSKAGQIAKVNADGTVAEYVEK